jgi:uncharacterized protein
VRRAACALAVLAALLAGCGGDDLQQAREDVEQRVEDARREFDERREQFEQRFEEILGDLRQAIPQAQRTDPQVRTRGRTEEATIDAFMDDVLRNIDGFWTQTFRENGLPEPRVAFVIVPPGRSVPTACGVAADDGAAFYCPADDTIYVAQVFAADLYQGVVRGLPGERAGFGRAAGDFAVAYVLAHEYAHNLQQELGIFDNAVTPRARPYELHADCWSGIWANSVYEQGLLEEGDLEEATNAALAVGDFDVGNAQHHGTPQERRGALLTGYRDGNPSVCSPYLEQS